MSIIIYILSLFVGATLVLVAGYASGYFKDRYLSDEILWEALPEEGLAYNQDESLMAVWEVRGPNLDFETPARADALAGSVARAIDSLDEQSMVHVNTLRVPSTEYTTAGGDAPLVARVADAERRARYEAGEHFEDRTYITLSVSYEDRLSDRLTSLFYTGSGAHSIGWERMVEDMERRAEDFESFLPAELRPRRVHGRALVSHLYQCLTGDLREVNAPPETLPSLRYLFADRLYTGFEPRVGDRFMRVVGIHGYPDTVGMDIVKPLQKLDFEYRYSTRLICGNQRAALSLLNRRKGTWGMQIRGFLDQVMGTGERDELNENTFARQQTREIEQAISKLQAGESSLVNMTSCVIVWGRTKREANRRALSVEKALREKPGLLIRRERDIASRAFIGSLPGHGYHNIQKYPMLSEAAVRLLPITSVYAGPKKNPCGFFEQDGEKAPPLFYASTRECIPYRFTPYVGDVGHQLVVGPTGSGKSILMAYQAMRHLHYPKSQVILMDRGYSFAPLCAALGGQHYDINADVGFQPLARIGQKSELRWAVSWVLATCKMQGVTITPEMRVQVEQALATIAEAHDDPQYRTLQELHTQLQVPELKAALDPFAGSGEVGMLLNATEDAFDRTGSSPFTSRFQVLELGPLLELDPQVYTPILLYFFHRIETLLSEEAPTFVGADEFYMFAAQSQAGREYVIEALRTYRKKNAAMSIATQDPTDLVGPDAGAILNSCRTKILVPNPDAADSAQRKGYEAIGLNEQEIDAVASAEPKREYVFKQPGGTRRADLALGVELEFMKAADGLGLKGTADAMRETAARNGIFWPDAWLERIGAAGVTGGARKPMDRAESDGSAGSAGDGAMAGSTAHAAPR